MDGCIVLTLFIEMLGLHRDRTQMSLQTDRV